LSQSVYLFTKRKHITVEKGSSYSVSQLHFFRLSMCTFY